MLTLPWRPHFYSKLHGWSEYSEVVVRGSAKSRRLWPIVIGRASEGWRQGTISALQEVVNTREVCGMSGLYFVQRHL